MPVTDPIGPRLQALVTPMKQEELIEKGKKLSSTQEVFFRTLKRVLTFRLPNLEEFYISKAKEVNLRANRALTESPFEGVQQVAKAILPSLQGEGVITNEALFKGLSLIKSSELTNVSWLRGRNLHGLDNKTIDFLSGIQALATHFNIQESEMKAFLEAVIRNRRIQTFGERDYFLMKALMVARVKHIEFSSTTILKLLERYKNTNVEEREITHFNQSLQKRVEAKPKIEELKKVSWLQPVEIDEESFKAVDYLYSIYQHSSFVSEEVAREFFAAVLPSHDLHKVSALEHDLFLLLTASFTEYPTLRPEEHIALLKALTHFQSFSMQETHEKLKLIAKLFLRSTKRTASRKELLDEVIAFTEAFGRSNPTRIEYAFNLWQFNHGDCAKAHAMDEEDTATLKAIFGKDSVRAIVEQGIPLDEEIVGRLSMLPIEPEERFQILQKNLKFLLDLIVNTRDISDDTKKALVKAAMLFPKTVEALAENHSQYEDRELLSLGHYLEMAARRREKEGVKDHVLAEVVTNDVGEFIQVIEELVYEVKGLSNKERTDFLERGYLTPDEIEEAAGDNPTFAVQRRELTKWLELHYPKDLQPLMRRYIEEKHPQVSSGKEPLDELPIKDRPFEEFGRVVEELYKLELNKERFPSPFLDRLFKEDPVTEEGLLARKKVIESIEALYQSLNKNEQIELYLLLKHCIEGEKLDLLFSKREETLSILKRIVKNAANEEIYCPHSLGEEFTPYQMAPSALNACYLEARRAKDLPPLAALRKSLDDLERLKNEERFRFAVTASFDYYTQGLNIDPQQRKEWIKHALGIKNIGIIPNESIARFAAKVGKKAATMARDKKAYTELIDFLRGKDLAGEQVAAQVEEQPFNLKRFSQTLQKSPERLITELLPNVSKALPLNKEEQERVASSAATLQTNQPLVKELMKRLGFEGVSLPEDNVAGLALPVGLFFNAIRGKESGKNIVSGLKVAVDKQINEKNKPHLPEQLSKAVDEFLNVVRKERRSPTKLSALLYFLTQPDASGLRGLATVAVNFATQPGILRSVTSKLLTAPLNLPGWRLLPDWFRGYFPLENIVTSNETKKFRDVLESVLNLTGLFWSKQQEAKYVASLNQLATTLWTTLHEEVTDSAFEVLLQDEVRTDLLLLVRDLLEGAEEHNQVINALLETLNQFGK